jgi:hypothetical protein
MWMSMIAQMMGMVLGIKYKQEYDLDLGKYFILNVLILMS